MWDPTLKHRKGFTALVAVLLLSFGTMTFSLSVLSAAVLYADSVRSREIRIQNRLNEQACADTGRLMAEKDYFLTGTVTLPEFGCTVEI